MLSGCNTVTPDFTDCAGRLNGEAFIDDCEQCVGGETPYLENYSICYQTLSIIIQ